MTNAVLCLRPEADFTRVGVTPPANLAIRYAAPADPDLAAFVKAADALVIPAIGPKLAPSLFEGGKVRLVQVTGAGVDRLDEPAMRKLAIPVANVPGGSNGAVAEYCVASALNLLRRLSWSSGEIKRGNYAAYRARMLADNLAGLEGLTVGIVGLGTIGVAVASAFAGQGSRIVYFDPKPRDPEAAGSQGWTSLPLDDLLATADVVTLHVPLLPATTGLIGARELARMKPTAVLVNAARGGIVDEAALAAALTEGRLGGAAVDVYSTEPPTADNPLLAVSGEAAERLLLTPHIAGVTRQASATLFKSSWDNIHRVLIDGKAPLNVCY
jgi:phosphoglycerate dehydrogenase-like enzyme